MLELNKIIKSYKTGTFVQQALKNVSLKFRKNEFVCILGPSGSGKTTLLNMIGGLDRYDKGDLIINNKSTNNFKDSDWDSYRNNCVGFVFQNYNLISHISVLSNIEMGMTLSGVKSVDRHEKAMQVLTKVGLEKHAHKKPNQLSGGQMQRVAIARALANDPEILLCDEPTGALDSATSIQILNLIKEIADDKLVIMVTHNSELATEYADRIIKMIDGEITDDTNPVGNEESNAVYKIRRTAMSFITALKLSYNNIKTKKGRTLLTSFASSIGIIGIALILSLSNGLDKQIAQFERDSLSGMPINISEESMVLNEDTMKKLNEENTTTENDYPDVNKIYPTDPIRDIVTHSNVLSEDFVEYVKNIDSSIISGMSFNTETNLNLITKKKDGSYALAIRIFGHIPQKIDGEDRYEFMNNTYDLLYGDYPTKKEELTLIVDSKNRVNKTTLEMLGFDSSKEEINFEEIIDKEFKLILNDEFYKTFGNFYTLNMDYESLYNSKSAITLKITGIIRGKEDKKLITSVSSGVGYTEELIDFIVEKNKNSKIVKAQKESNYNILTGEVFEDDKSKETMISYLGGNSAPSTIQVYSKDFDSKTAVLKYLDEYNIGRKDEDKVLYTDLGELISTFSGNLMNGVTYVLIGFSAISLVVSTIMIAIITYISVLERTKEIGILRSLGARKKDITRVFNAETFIIGVCSGILGIIIARILLFPINIILESLADLKNVAILSPVHALVLITVSVILTLLGGSIPAKMASKKNPVEALRTE